jgi:hypothetical protein
MTDSQNIQIPLLLFKKIYSLFSIIAVSDRYTLPAMFEFDAIYAELKEKQHRINLRTQYTNTIYAKTDEQRNLARNNYIKLKNHR